MAKEPKTKQTTASVESFIDALGDEQTREDCRTIIGLMRASTKAEPKMWGPAIVGFGTFPLKYANGEEREWPLIAFSPRKQNLTLYIEHGFEKYDELLSKLGKYKVSKACLYIKSLKDIEIKILEKLIQGSVTSSKKKYSLTD